MLNPQNIIEYISKVDGLSHFERFNSSDNIQNELIQINLDERPNVIIAKNHLGDFFIDYANRCKFLNKIINLDWKLEVSNMVKYINNEIDEINIYHYSLFPQKMQNELITFDKFQIVNLDEDRYNDLLESHLSFKHSVDNNKYIRGYRSLLISEEIAVRRNSTDSYHLWYDRLDEIYSFHRITRFLLKYFAGNIESLDSSISTDNFPHSNSSQSSKVIKTEIQKIEDTHIDKISRIISFLSDKLTYRLIIKSEFSARLPFERAIFLRSILDPILEKNKTTINGAFNPNNGIKKTNIQAQYILKTLLINNGQYSNLVKLNELTDFLQIRNSIIHPTPTDTIEKMHLLYEKTTDFRKVIYEFLFIAINKNITNGLSEFELDTVL